MSVKGPKPFSVAASTGDSGGTIYIDGKKVGSVTPVARPRILHERPLPSLDPCNLSGPKLKVERAKEHIAELETVVRSFHDSKPYEFFMEKDDKTGEQVVRVRVHKAIPKRASTVVGDAVHNLRSALDQLVCDLITANRQQIRRGSGFPISGTVKHFETNSVGKIRGVSAKADTLIRRLKPYKGGNTPLWMLHELDALDKHQGIIPVAAASLQVLARWNIPFLSMSPEGGLAIGSTPAGYRPLSTGVGVPEGAKIVCPLEDNAEIYRFIPSPIHHEFQIAASVAFGQTQFTKGEPVIETLHQLRIFVERTIAICETKIL